MARRLLQIEEDEEKLQVTETNFEDDEEFESKSAIPAAQSSLSDGAKDDNLMSQFKKFTKK
jgi:hypothetical protein